MRCRTLARELRRRGADVHFLCRRHSGHLIPLLEREFPVVQLVGQPGLPGSLAGESSLEGRELYAEWLGCSQQEDARHCLEGLAAEGITGTDWLVVDHYGLGATWEEAMLAVLGHEAAGAGSPPPRLLVIDDLADRSHLADLLLDQNYFGEATERRYHGLVPETCRQLLGPRYALLGQEYSQLHPLVPARTELRRVLVFFGGVDTTNLTGRTIESLMAPELAHLAVDVVLGMHSPHRSAVKTLVSQRPHTTLHEPLPSLAGLITRADLAIGAGGATTWERTCLGLPSLVAALAANQTEQVRSLSELGACSLLENGFSKISAPAETFLREASKACYKLTDGSGVVYTADSMLFEQHSR